MFTCSMWLSRPTSTWTNRFQCLRTMFILALRTSTSSTVIGRWMDKTLVHSSVVSRVDCCNMVPAGSHRSVTDKLQWVLNAAACLVSSTEHARVWLCIDAASASPLILARCGTPDLVQAQHDRPPVSAPQSSAVAGSLLRHSLRLRQSSATLFGMPSPAGRTTLPTQHTQPSGILCRRTHRLELASRWTGSSKLCWWNFLTIAENISVHAVLVCTVH